jgi:hypothetical protein
MARPAIWPLESERAKPANELTPLDGLPSGHGCDGSD